MKIVGALLARNEADRYLEEVLENANEYCDELIVVDDNSEDNTRDVCSKWARVHHYQNGSGGEFWGADETNLRRLLWELASDAGGKDSWIYVFDADQLLTGITPLGLRTLCRTSNLNSWAFPLYDCWDSHDTHRTDTFWAAWAHPRVWLARAIPVAGFQPDWGTPKGIHSGHIPHNYPLKAGLAPYPAAIQHLGYIKESDRAAKAQKYLDLA